MLITGYVDEIDALWQEVEQEMFPQSEGRDTGVAAMQVPLAMPSEGP